MKIKFLLLFLILLGVSMFLFYNQKSSNLVDIVPMNLNRGHMCACDSMIIVNYQGPKAQIIWKDGKRSYYCEVREAFYESTNKITNKNIRAFFVQDFANLTWGSYIDKWVLANNMFYVIDSSKDGAMGLTYVPFSNVASANEFLMEFGGKLVSYGDINSDVLSYSMETLKNRIVL